MCGVEVLLCLACGAGVGTIAAWKARGAMVHKGKVVVDQQGRVMGKDGKLLRDKKTGNFVYIDKDVKDKKKPKGPAAASGETHRKTAKTHAKVESTSKMAPAKIPQSRMPFAKKNTAPAPASAATAGDDEGGAWSADELSAWRSHVKGKEN